MLKQLLVFFCFIVSLSSAYAELSEKMNYGWVNRATSNEFDPSTLASSLRYFKNNCAAGTEPCSPDSGVQADGSLFCATGNSTGACYNLSTQNNGMTNLKEHLTTKCGSSCLQAEKDFYPWYSKKVEFCKSRTNFNCASYNENFAPSIRSYYVPSSAALNAASSSLSTGNNKLIRDLPSGDKNSCDLVKGQGSRVGQNDSPFWKDILSLGNKVCGRNIENIVGFCSASALPAGMPDDLKNVVDRIRRGEAYDQDIFKSKMGMNINQFKDVFCQPSTYNFVQKANSVAKVVTFPPGGSKYPYSGKSQWLQDCMSSGMIIKGPTKVVKSKAGATTATIETEVYKTNAAGNCDFIPVTDLAQALRSGNPSLMFKPKDENIRPGAALCMLVKDVNLVSDETNAARLNRGLSAMPSSMKLYVPNVGEQSPSTYQFENVGALANEFNAYRWHCSTAADYEVKPTGGDASAAEQ